MSSTESLAATDGLRASNKHRTRERILMTALDLIEARGWSATTIDEIASTAGVGRRTFFRYFACKEALLFGSSGFQRLAEDLTGQLDRGATPLEALAFVVNQDEEVEPGSVTLRRRELRRELLAEPSVENYYLHVFDDFARTIAQTVRAHRLYSNEPFLPELLGGLVRIMAAQHLNSGGLQRLTVDVRSWRSGLEALTRPFSSTSTVDVEVPAASRVLRGGR